LRDCSVLVQVSTKLCPGAFGERPAFEVHSNRDRCQVDGHHSDVWQLHPPNVFLTSLLIGMPELQRGNRIDTSATPEHQTTTAAILLRLSNIRRMPPLYFCNSRTSDDYGRYTSATPEHQTTMAAILPQLSNIRRLWPLYFCNSRTSDDYGRYTSATLKHPTTGARHSRYGQTARIRGSTPARL
jgi:hypothetical protein